MKTGWTRAAHRGRLEEDSPFDVIVIGGGITGAGAALDLAARGAHVALVEQTDFAQGTSSRSTKLFHGGIRYLPHFELSLVSDGLREQKVLARIADFLYEPLEFVIPMYSQYGLADAPRWAARGWHAPIVLDAGLWLYDILGGFGRPGRRHRRVNRDRLVEMMPSLRTEGLKSGVVYSDAQTDDARLVVTILKTAVRRFGVVATGRVEATEVTSGGAGYRLTLRDTEEGELFEVQSRAVLATTGAFQPPPLDGAGRGIRLVLSKGIHVIIDRSNLGIGDRALVLPETDDGRVLFIIPWLDHAMIGTTDTPYDSDLTHPRATADDVDYLIRHVHRYLEAGPITPLSVFAGLRALADTGALTTARASREHVVTEISAGYVQVAGGKLTTYRRIAAEAADQVAAALALDVASSTSAIPLVGAAGHRPTLTARLRDVGVPEPAIEPTISRYGLEAEMIARLVAEDPVLSSPLSDGRTTLADVVYATREEGATRVSDITLRRTHIAWFTPDHGRKDAPAIAEAMARELGWSSSDIADELAAHHQELSAEGL